MKLRCWSDRCEESVQESVDFRRNGHKEVLSSLIFLSEIEPLGKKIKALFGEWLSELLASQPTVDYLDDIAMVLNMSMKNDVLYYQSYHCYLKTVLLKLRTISQK